MPNLRFISTDCTLRPAPFVSPLSVDAANDVERHGLPSVDRSKHFGQSSNDDSAACDNQDLSRWIPGYDCGGSPENFVHIDPFVFDTWTVKRRRDELEGFGRMDDFTGSIHLVPAFRCEPYSSYGVGASATMKITGFL